MQTRKTSFLRDFITLVAPYWQSEDKWRAWLLLVVVVSMNLGLVYLSVLFNQWNNDFYNALQNLDKDGFFAALLKFGWLAGLYIVTAVYMLYLNQMLQIRWRAWVTRRYLDDWLGGTSYYRMQLLGESADNPDQRISEDIERLTSQVLTLGMRLLRSVVTLVSFVFILWTLSGPLTIPLGGYGEFTLQGYMVWAALIYAFVGTWLTMRIGNPLVRLNFDQQRYEADFRFSLVRLRENSESVAIYGGEDREKATFARRFGSVVGNFREIMRRQKKLTWLTSGYNQASIIFPLLVAAPRFFAGQIQLGGLMQISSAFNHVHDALSYLINSYVEIAELRAVVERLSGFTGNIRRVQAMRAQDKIVRARPDSGPDSGRLRVGGLTLRLPDGQSLTRELTVDLGPGDSLLVTGPSGAGKSTLLRGLAGIWPFGEGSVAVPCDGPVMFVSQKPYLPLGSLRDTLFYPAAPRDDGNLDAILGLCGLDAFRDRLDAVENWSAVLSPGEQQRVAFARVFLARPSCIFLDEATASLDEPTEAALYAALRRRLPESIVVSVGHRSTLAAWHNRRLRLSGHDWTLEEQSEPAGAMPTPEPAVA
jgi:putative ATP-binding cassette transporter